MSPSQAAAQGQNGNWTDGLRRVETRTELTPPVRRALRIVVKCERAAVRISLGVSRRLKHLELRRSVGRDAPPDAGKPVASLNPAAEVLADKAALQPIAADAKAIGRDPMVGKRSRCREICWPCPRGAICSDQQSVTPAAAKAFRQPPIGGSAGNREAGNGVRCKTIIQPDRNSVSAQRHVVRTDRRVAAKATCASKSR